MISSNFNSKQQINVNLTQGTMIFSEFLMVLPEYSLKMWLPLLQGRVFNYHLDYKISPIHVGGKVSKIQ